MREINLKVGNMSKPQSFTLYPYAGGETIDLQSDKRWITANLKTGEGKINNKNERHPTSYHLAVKPISIKLPDEILKQIKEYLLKNDGRQGELKRDGVTLLSWENKKFIGE